MRYILCTAHQPASINQLGSSNCEDYGRRIAIGPTGRSGAGSKRILVRDWTTGAWLVPILDLRFKFTSWIGSLRSVCCVCAFRNKTTDHGKNNLRLR